MLHFPGICNEYSGSTMCQGFQSIFSKLGHIQDENTAVWNWLYFNITCEKVLWQLFLQFVVSNSRWVHKAARGVKIFYRSSTCLELQTLFHQYSKVKEYYLISSSREEKQGIPGKVVISFLVASFGSVSVKQNTEPFIMNMHVHVVQSLYQVSNEMH